MVLHLGEVEATTRDCKQPKVTDAKGGWLSLPHIHKSRLDILEADIHAVKRGFLPSVTAVSPLFQMLRRAQ
ncbi:hypothetical protein, partial [Phaeobacter sp. 11ANDIMAR09]|uniref:hypothetical protein n=1 Tax=Phaeobacter sp. 11ANDIMAR09 TaxID=1225647 RepID=UPI000B1600FC